MIVLLNAGDDFGDYRIEENIAIGRHAEVYRASSKKDNSAVALKIFNPELSPDDRKRFRAEISAIGRLRDRRIIEIFDYGEAELMRQAAPANPSNPTGNSVFYVAMKYVDRGKYARADLRTVLDSDGPLEPRVALALLHPVASALEKMHQEGHVHKDVKSSNILVELGTKGLSDSQVFVAGLGTTHSETVFAGNRVPISGTLPYVPPEVLAGEVPTSRADTYSLACVAFEVLTNSPPYDDALKGGDIDDVKVSIRSAPIPRLKDNRDLLRQVTVEQAEAADQVFAKALDKNPDQRYETVREFMSELTKALSEPVQTRLRKYVGQHKGWVIAGLIAAVVVAIGVPAVARFNSIWETSEPTAAAPVEIRYPASWKRFDQPGDFSLFAERDWRGFFVHSPSAETWKRFEHDLASDPASLVGFLALQLDEPARGVTADQQNRLSALLPGRIGWTPDEANEIEIDQKPARWFTGVLRPLDSSAALRLRAVFIQEPQNGSVVLLFFAPSPSLDEDAPTSAFGKWRDRFVEMQNSARLQ